MVLVVLNGISSGCLIEARRDGLTTRAVRSFKLSCCMFVSLVFKPVNALHGTSVIVSAGMIDALLQPPAEVSPRVPVLIV